jgi:isocitrate lyase
MTTLIAPPASDNDPITTRHAAQPDAAVGGFEGEVAAIRAWFAEPRFEGIVRLHTAREVAEQRGSIVADYRVARDAAVDFHALLRRRFDERRAITTFGPYSPGQAVAQKRQGLEAIYLGGWATSAKGSTTEDPGPDLASYPLSAVPDEAAGIVRALLTADRNQQFARSRLSEAERMATPVVDYRPFIIADADTGHGGDAHVRNLIRRFVEVGVPGYHIEDQRPGAKKCGHQDGKVLVAQNEQNKRLNAARLQLDVMGIAGIIVARTDAESATLIDDMSDERDQPFVLGATVPGIPTFRVGSIAILRRLHDAGLDDVHGHQLFAISERDHQAALAWLDEVGLLDWLDDRARTASENGHTSDVGAIVDEADRRYVDAWQAAAGIGTYGEAVAAALEKTADPAPDPAVVEAWLAFAATASLGEARARARELGVDPHWDPDAPRTPDGYYRVRGGIDYAIAKSLAAAPFADLLWMETKTADLADARRFAEAIHAVFPDKMLAYNLSPSFNWDTTGMTDDDMRRFPDELGRAGFVFDFITYGGHQIDGLAAEEFATSLQADGMLALARLQRRLRLVESPYRTPQALVGGPRADAALMAASGRTASTRAMGARSTHHQHLVETEITPRLLATWLDAAGASGQAPEGLGVQLRPQEPGSDRRRLVLGGPGAPVLVIGYVPLASDGEASVAVGSVTSAPVRAAAELAALGMLFIVHRERAERLLLTGTAAGDLVGVQRLSRLGAVTKVQTADGVTVASVDPDCVRALVTLAPGELVRLVFEA